MNTHTVQRINITLPSVTLMEVDSVVQKGGRSKFIKRALDFYIQEMKKEQLKGALKEESLARFDENRSMAEDWFAIEEELWENKK